MNTPTKKTIIISGPTGCGKTSTSITLGKALAEKGIKSVIVNFDSLCFYKELNIGTAKPTKKERNQHPHSLIDLVSISEDFNSSHFIKSAEEEISKLHQQGIIPLLVGGSAFYLRALIKGMYESESTPENIRREIEELQESEGVLGIINKLNELDPEATQTLHPNDEYRLTRALEHCLTTGDKWSDQKKKKDEIDPYDLANNIDKDWDIFHIYLNIQKEEHYPLIERRAREMVDNGLIEEVQALLEAGFKGTEKAMGSIGYKEVVSWINESKDDREALIEEIFIHTRQLAKSQRTFFNKIHPKIEYHPLQDQKKIIAETLTFVTT